MTRRILAIGGGGFMMERGVSELDRFFVRLAGARRPKVCFIGTGSGDAEQVLAKYYRAFAKLDCRASHLAFFRKPRPGALALDATESALLAQDAIYVGGGNTRSMLAVWREWGLDGALRKAWEAGIVLGGVSAGAICWFEYGATDSMLGPGRSSPLTCLGFLAGSCAPHFDGERDRRADFARLIAARGLPHGIGIDDGAAVLYEDQSIAEVVSSRSGATAHRSRGGQQEISFESLPARQLSRSP
jgi:dipeptidase E